MSKYLTNMNLSGASSIPFTQTAGNQSSVSAKQGSSYFIPNSYNIQQIDANSYFQGKNEIFSYNKSSASTINEAPFNQPCQISVESEYNKVSNVIDTCFANNPAQKELILNDLKSPYQFESNYSQLSQPSNINQPSKKNNFVKPMDLNEKNIGYAGYGQAQQLLTPKGYNKIQSQDQKIDQSNFQDSKYENNVFQIENNNPSQKNYSLSSNVDEYKNSYYYPQNKEPNINLDRVDNNVQIQQQTRDYQTPIQNTDLDQQQQFYCIKQNLEVQIQILEGRLFEVDSIRQKYFKMMIDDIKREKEREITYIQSLITKNIWQKQQHMKGIDSIKRKITDIGIEMNDLKDLKNVHTKFKPSIYYDPNRASKILNFRRSNSASQILSYIRDKPLDIPQILENHPKEETETLHVKKQPYYQKHFTDFKQPEYFQGLQYNQNTDFNIEKNNSTYKNTCFTPNKSSQVAYQQPNNQNNDCSFKTPKNLVIESNLYQPLDLNVVSANKSQGSSTPYSQYAEKLGDQKSWFNEVNKQEKEINLDQYKKTIPTQHKHLRNQSLYTQKIPYYENNSNLSITETFPIQKNICQSQKANNDFQIPSQKFNNDYQIPNQKINNDFQISSPQKNKNQEAQLGYKIHPPSNQEDKSNQIDSQNSSQKNESIQIDMEKQQSQRQNEEENVKRTPQSYFQNNNLPYEDQLEEGRQSNRVWANIMNSQKKKLTESNHSSRYSACNDEIKNEQEQYCYQYNSIANSEQNCQEPKFYHSRKFNSDQKANKNEIINNFIDNTKQNDYRDFSQITPEITDSKNNQNNYQFYQPPFQSLQNQQFEHQLFYHQIQTPNQSTKNSQIDNNCFENIIQNVKLNNQENTPLAYFPSERVETARFENFNEIHSRKGLHFQSELNFLSAQSFDRHHESKPKSEKNNDSYQNNSYENFSIKQNTPSQTHKDFDSFAQENISQNMNNSLNNSKNKEISVSNNCGTDLNKLSQGKCEQSMQGQGENRVAFNNLYNPQIIKDINSMISSQQRQDTQSFLIQDQDPSMLFSTTNNNMNYLPQFQIDQSHTYVNQGESFFSEKDQIRASQKKQGFQNQSRGQYDFENQSLRQDNLPIIEEQIQNSDESERSSLVHQNQKQFQLEFSNILDINQNNNAIDSINSNHSSGNQTGQNTNKSLENSNEDQQDKISSNEVRIDSKNTRNIQNQIIESQQESMQQNIQVKTNNQRNSNSNLAVSKQSMSNMEVINKKIERHATVQSSVGSEVALNIQQSQKEKRFQDSKQYIQQNQLNQLSQSESSDRIATNTRTQAQTMNDLNEFQNLGQLQQNDRRTSLQQNQDYFFLGNVKARTFFADREFREYLTEKNQKNGVQQDQRINQQTNNKIKIPNDESNFAKCILIYNYNNQCLRLLFNSSLLQSSDADQTVIDEIPVSQINIDQLDLTNLRQNTIFLKLSYKNKPLLNNKIALLQLNSSNQQYEGYDDYFNQKNQLEILKNKIIHIYQLRDDPEDLNSKLILISQPTSFNNIPQPNNVMSSDMGCQNSRNGEEELEESKSDSKREVVQEYIPSTQRMAQKNYTKQMQEREICNSIHYSNEGEANHKQSSQKQKLGTPQFEEIQSENLVNNYESTMQSPVHFNQRQEDLFEQQENRMEIKEEKQRQKGLPEIMEENSEQIKQKSRGMSQRNEENKEKQELQIFSGFSNHESVLKQNIVDLSQKFFQNNQRQFSTIKRENEDIGEESQDIENNIRQFNEPNSIEDYQPDQAEFDSSQIKEQNLKQKIQLYNKYKMAQYGQRTEEEDNLLKILKNFDEKQYIMKKYGQNSSSYQVRRIFFSSDFRFFCWKGVKSPELKRIFPINKFKNYIMHGRNTDNFKRFKSSNLSDNDCSFSLILEDRTIDLQAQSIQEKEQFIKGLQIIFNCIL